jgi:nucleoside-diphosphate-sugar epimerase
MRVVIAGGHGQIALLLAARLSTAGHEAAGLIRNAAQTGDVRAAGAEPVVCDLETSTVDDVAAQLKGADAVVFAAGAGPNSGAARKDTVDRGAAALLADAAQAAGVGRYLLVSSVGAGAAPPPGTGDVFAAYLRAKTAAEDDLRGRPLRWTSLRPGQLTDEPATGDVLLVNATDGGSHVPRGAVPRDDVAAVLVALLDRPDSEGTILELIGGRTPIATALDHVLG